MSSRIGSRTVAEKMGVRTGSTACIEDAPHDILARMELPHLAMTPDSDTARNFMLVFVERQAALNQVFPNLKERLAMQGALWVCWPKGRQHGTDLTIRDVIRIGYSHRLVESKAISIDATWSALKFTHPRPGKNYSNRYGTLPGKTA
jgi:hypothetical protein